MYGAISWPSSWLKPSKKIAISCDSLGALLISCPHSLSSTSETAQELSHKSYLQVLHTELVSNRLMVSLCAAIGCRKRQGSGGIT